MLTDAQREQLNSVCDETIAPHASELDQKALFPKSGLQALGQAGVLGALSATSVGGWGGGPIEAVEVISRVARACGSTAMVTTMHFAGTIVLETCASDERRRELASGRRIASLAFSEVGSYSHFWVPLSHARELIDEAQVQLEARKSWVTSAHHASDLVWSSKPLHGAEGLSLWHIDAQSSRSAFEMPPAFDGLGLRGNDSTPITTTTLRVPRGALIGKDGAGTELVLGLVLPYFGLMSAACSLGLMDAALASAIAHLSRPRFAHLDQRLCDLPTIRAQLARAQVRADQCRSLLQDAASAVASSRADAVLRVLESKAACGDGALEVTDAVMRICGGAAFRKDLGIERIFRDARAANIMAPTSDQLYDFIGRLLCGMPLFD